jgi:hypothetical protein
MNLNRWNNLTKPVQQYSSAVKVIVDGNSLVVNMASDNGGGSLANLVPMNQGVVLAWRGVNGQTWRMMNGLDGGSATDVDSAFDPTKTNILFALEGTNSISNTSVAGAPGSAEYVWASCRDYCLARRAANPELRIILMTTTPALQPGDNTAQRNQRNANIDAYNALMRNGFRDAGAVGYTDIRYKGGPFDYPDYEPATFETSNTPLVLWSTTDNAGQHIHLSTLGGRVNMRLMANALKRLAKTPF